MSGPGEAPFWNYRVVRSKHGDEEVLAIHEAYYDAGASPKGRPRTITSDPVDPHSDSLEGLKVTLRAMLQATLKPGLEYEDF